MCGEGFGVGVHGDVPVLLTEAPSWCSEKSLGDDDSVVHDAMISFHVVLVPGDEAVRCRTFSLFFEKSRVSGSLQYGARLRLRRRNLRFHELN